MNLQLKLRPRALTELEKARDQYDRVGHGEGFLAELDVVLDAIRAMPERFPIHHGLIRRALIRRYPFAVFFRIRPESGNVIVLAVLPQRADPAKWPRR